MCFDFSPYFGDVNSKMLDHVRPLILTDLSVSSYNTQQILRPLKVLRNVTKWCRCGCLPSTCTTWRRRKISEFSTLEHLYLFTTSLTWCSEASYTTRPCWTWPRTTKASSWTCGSFQRCPNSLILTKLTPSPHFTANSDVQHELHIVPLWRPVLPPGIAGLCCQKCSLAAKLNPQASQSRDRVVLTTDAGLSRSSMEPYFQNPHLDYQISVLPLPPEVTCQLDIKYADQGAGRYMFLASHWL